MTAYAMSLDGHSFERDEIFFHGPLEQVAPQNWSTQHVLGGADPGDIKTFLGTGSQVWPMDGTFDTTSKDKLKSIYVARLPVTFITPQDGTGFSVLLEDLVIDHIEPSAPEGEALGKFHCTFILTQR